jgi:predicted AAA+ superfamily ATPase
MWFDRHMAERLITSVKSRPAVLLTGARQTGKSSLLQREFPETEYLTFDHLRNVESAKDSPEHFLSNFTRPVILDEIQYVPEIFKN